MKSKFTEETLKECLEFVKCSELPHPLDKSTSDWSLAIALVERQSSVEDYVIVKNKRGKVVTRVSFLSMPSIIKSIKEIYPYELFDRSLLPTLNSDKSKIDFLSHFYERNEYLNNDNSLNKEKAEGLIIEQAIKLTKREKEINNQFIAKPKKIENGNDNKGKVTGKTKGANSKDKGNK